MNILAIDTATDVEIIAASRGAAVSDATRRAGMSHSITMFGAIDEALRKLGITIHDINLIGVGIGPGSFTGIRIAVTTARMLAQILRVPLAPLHSPLLYAASVAAARGDFILAAFDAKKGKVFGALYRKTDNELVLAVIVPPGDYLIGDLTARVEKQSNVFCIGSGAARYREAVAGAIPHSSFPEDFFPSGEIACRLAKHVFSSTPDLCSPVGKITPMYTRKSDAEIALESKNAAGEKN